MFLPDRPAVVTLQIDIVEPFRDALATAITFLPRLIGALAILLVGWIIGRILGGLTRRLVDRIELDELVLDTPLGQVLGGTERAVSSAFGTLVRWFVLALAILAAADVLAIRVLSEWLDTAVSYLPAFIAGLLIIVLGFVVADFIGDAIMRTSSATGAGYTRWFATGTQMFLYFIVIVIGLDTMGVDVGILYVFARALAWGLAAAIAIGVGVALGWGGKDYVSNNIDDWAEGGSAAMPSGGGSGDGPGGGDTGDGAGTSPNIGAEDVDGEDDTGASRE